MPKTTSSGGKALASALASFVAALAIYKDMGLNLGDHPAGFPKAFHTPSVGDRTRLDKGLQFKSISLLSLGYVWIGHLVIVPTKGLDGPMVSREEKETAARKNRLSRAFFRKSSVFSLNRRDFQAVTEPRMIS